MDHQQAHTPSRLSRNIPRKPNFLVGLSGMLASGLVKSWMSTLDYRVVYYDRSVDPANGVDKSRIYVFWHENILLPLYLRGRCHLSMLLSQHRDADVLARVAYHSGFDCVRGSTYRGGAKAIRELDEKSQDMHLTITPDGPRGPRRRLAQGPVYLASRLQLPLVVLGFGYDRPWRAKSWDRFAVPRPFSRARAIVGPAMLLPTDLDRAGISNACERVERLMNCLTMEAESWAESGKRKAGEEITCPLSAPPPSDILQHQPSIRQKTLGPFAAAAARAA